MPPVITINDLKFAYPTDRDTCVLDIPSLSIEAEQHVFLFGPSGSGKSTLLNLLTGLLLPDSGEVRVLNQDWKAMKGRHRDSFRAEHVGFVFQQLNLIPYLTVLDNILLGCTFSKKSNSYEQLLPEIKELLSDLQVSVELLNKQAKNLSVGQQQRVAIARALIKKPEVLIADEPTSALDEASRNAFMMLLFKLAKKAKTTLVFVSHDQTLAKDFDRVIDIQSINHVSRSYKDVF